MSRKEKSKEDLKEAVLRLISLFREEIQKLPQEQQKLVPEIINNLSLKVAQFMVIWAKNPEFQIILLTRLPQLEEGYYEIYGPTLSSNLINYIKKSVIKKSRIVKSLGEEKIEQFLYETLEKTIKSNYDPFLPSSKILEIIPLSTSYSNIFAVTLTILGNLSKMDLKKIVSNELISSKILNIQQTTQTSSLTKGYGAYIYPPISIGNIQNPQITVFSDQLQSEPIIFYKYKGKQIVITRDGYIAVEEEDKGKVLDLINEILSVMYYCGIPVYSVSLAELGQAVFSNGNLISISISPPSIGDSLLVHLNEDKMKDILNFAEKITEDSKKKEILRIFLEAHTLFEKKGFTHAFREAWKICETYVKDLCDTKGICNTKTKEKEQLKRMIDKLRKLKDLSDTDYNLLDNIDKLRPIRNRIVHGGKIMEENEEKIAKDCIELARKIVVEIYVKDKTCLKN